MNKLKEYLSDKNKRLVFYNILVVIVVLYALFTYGRAHIQGDNAQSLRYANAILAEHSLFPKEWSYMNGEFYIFNSMPFAVAFCMFIGNKSIAIALGTLVTLGIAAAGIILLSERVFKSKCWALIIPFFLLFLSSSEARYMIIYMGAYVMEMTAITLVFYLLYKGIKETSIGHLIAHSILLFIMIAGGSRYLAEYSLPVLAAFLFACYLQVREMNVSDAKPDFKYLGKVFLLVVIPSLVGFIFYKYMASTHSMVGNGVENIVLEDSVWVVFSNILTVICGFFNMFGYNANAAVVSILGLQSLVGIILCIIICFVIPLLQAVKIKGESKEVQLYFIFGIAHNLVLFMVAVLCGKCTERYLLSSAYVWILISGRFLYEYLLKNKKYKALLWEVLFAVAIIIESFALLHTTTDSKDGLASYEKICDTLLEHGLNYGYASYWSGYPLEVYSDNAISMGGVQLTERTINKYYCLNDSNVFTKDCDRTFVMLTKEENEASNSAIYIQLGDPVEDFVIEDVYLSDQFDGSYTATDLYVYVFDHDAAADMGDGVYDGVLDVSELYFNWLGTRTETEIYMDKGGIVYGPYCNIEPGSYMVTYEGYGFDFLDLDIYSAANPDAVSYEILSQDETTAQVALTITDSVKDIQFTATNNTDERAALVRIRVE